MKLPTLNTDAVVWFLLAAAAGAFVLTVGAFYVTFHDFPIQKDSAAWSSFGGYFGGILGPVLGMLNLGALMFIAVRITDVQQKNLASKRLSIDLFSEWNAPTLHESRRAVSDLVAQVARGERLLPTLWELEEAETELSLHAFRLYHFFERWAVLVELNEIDERILISALAGRAHWYRRHFFEPIRGRENNEDMRQTLDRIEKFVFSKLPPECSAIQ